MLRRLTPLLAALATIFIGMPQARAAFHEWDIKEIYSNADGSVQYIELYSTLGNQTFLDNHTITADSDGTLKTFTFNANFSGSSTNEHLLIATPGFAALPGARTPDYILPCGPFFDPAAASITINFVGADMITIDNDPPFLPTNGTDSLTDANVGMVTANLVVGASSPEPNGGTAGAMALTGCLQAGTCEPCDDGLFCNGAEACSASACVATGACQDICDETADTCVECNVPADCDDTNVCTTDTCTANVCANTNNTLACVDGLFCTQTDACAAGSCVGSGDPCTASNCLEGINACGDCALDSECDDGDPCITNTCTVSSGACVDADAANGTVCAADGAFCTGVEGCQSGLCTSPGDPCTADEVCDVASDTCVPNCGNGAIDGTEACDDGDATSGDGCAANCTVEAGYTCDASEPSVCTSQGTGTGGGGTGGGGSGGSGTGGATGGGGAGGEPVGESSGCGCHVGGRSGSVPPVFVVLSALAAFALAGRRKRLARMP